MTPRRGLSPPPPPKTTHPRGTTPRVASPATRKRRRETSCSPNTRTGERLRHPDDDRGRPDDHEAVRRGLHPVDHVVPELGHLILVLRQVTGAARIAGAGVAGAGPLAGVGDPLVAERQHATL